MSIFGMGWDEEGAYLGDAVHLLEGFDYLELVGGYVWVREPLWVCEWVMQK